MTSIKKIIEAWNISFHPTKKQLEQGNLRLEICEKCDSKINFPYPMCKECGCPIGKKIFTNDFNPCPLKKWGDIDNLYVKKKTTLI